MFNKISFSELIFKSRKFIKLFFSSTPCTYCLRGRLAASFLCGLIAAKISFTYFFIFGLLTLFVCIAQKNNWWLKDD